MLSSNHIQTLPSLFNNHHVLTMYFCLQILVATLVQSMQAQLEPNVGSPADSPDTSGQDIASKVEAVNARSSRAPIWRYLDPLDWSKYYTRYTDSAGNVRFIHHKCPNNLVFNPATEQCTPKRDEVNDPPRLQHIDGTECNGNQGYYCNNDKFTYCTADKLKIVEDQSCPEGSGCNLGPSNPCFQ
jgi:hypothetical protein